MPQSTAPFILRDTSLVLQKVEPTGTAPAEEFRCQLNSVVITPSTGGGAGEQTYETFCETFTSGGGNNTTFTLDLGGFQAWADVADLSVILWNDAGSEYTFSLVPMTGPVSVTSPSFTGIVTLVEPQVGGTANTYASFTVSLPCKSKPTMVTIAPFPPAPLPPAPADTELAGATF